MDAGASQLLLGAETQKLFGGQDACQDKDVISRLPEEILVRILSFLSTEEAIKTSILSKRWKYLWMSVPNFYFDSSLHWSSTKSCEQILELEASFSNTIERVLSLRNASCLGNFYLSLTMHVGASRLHSWVSAAIKRKVQKLVLSLPSQGDFLLPSILFSSKSLNLFWLNMFSTLKVPSFICFSGLKELYLRGVVFQDNQSAQQLFSGCPFLEDLSLYSCSWENIKEITIEIPTLRSLTFSDSCYFLDTSLNGKIIISALNLETLDVRGSLSIELFPCNLISLNSAKIDTKIRTRRQGLSHRVVKLLSGLYNVRSLHLSNKTLEHLLLSENVEGRLPTFSNLTNLCAFVEHPLVGEEYHTSGAWVYILQKSPNLENLNLPKGFEPQEQDMIMETVPHCFQSCLKRFIIFNVDGNGDDLCLLKHVYKNALLLNRLVINCSPNLSEDLKKQEEIRQQLQPLRGSAANCSIEFIPYSDPLSW